MYLWIKLQKESQEFQKKHFPDEYWTAEFAWGYRLEHRPWMTLFALTECTLEIGAMLLICAIFFH